jgi:hypothetical protein
MFRIIAEYNHCFVRVGCFICGERFDFGLTAYLLRDDEDHASGHFQYICPDCAVRDAHGLREGLRARLEELRARADEMEEFLEEEFVEEQIKPYDASDYADTVCEDCGPVQGARMKPYGLVKEAEGDSDGLDEGEEPQIPAPIAEAIAAALREEQRLEAFGFHYDRFD